VGTVDGIAVFDRAGPKQWSLRGRALEGCFVSALTPLQDGALIAVTHGLGVARSDDGGITWRLVNAGLTHFDVWVVKAARLHGKERLFAGTLPAHLFVSDDGGASWKELNALTEVPSAPRWSFPPPPHQGHVLDIGVLGDSLYVGIEVGALLRSDDGGRSFAELPVNRDASEVDIHRLALHAKRPARIIAATRGVGRRLRRIRRRHRWADLRERRRRRVLEHRRRSRAGVERRPVPRPCQGPAGTCWDGFPDLFRDRAGAHQSSLR
jgi:hypothetical protein